jgi:hypothetical protein
MLQLQGHQLRLYKRRLVSMTQSNFFSQRVINDWNGLPDEVVDAPSLAVFKKRLDKYMDSEEMSNKSCELTQLITDDDDDVNMDCK